MNAEVAKILGDNLESNGTMVLFGDLNITLEMESEYRAVGTVVLAEFDNDDDATACLNEIFAYLEEKAKSNLILFAPKFTLENLYTDVKVPLMYQDYGSTLDHLNVVDTNLINFGAAINTTETHSVVLRFFISIITEFN